jgi:hypothetical protein
MFRLIWVKSVPLSLRGNDWRRTAAAPALGIGPVVTHDSQRSCSSSLLQEASCAGNRRIRQLQCPVNLRINDTTHHAAVSAPRIPRSMSRLPYPGSCIPPPSQCPPHSPASFIGQSRRADERFLDKPRGGARAFLVWWCRLEWDSNHWSSPRKRESHPYCLKGSSHRVSARRWRVHSSRNFA